MRILVVNAGIKESDLSGKFGVRWSEARRGGRLRAEHAMQELYDTADLVSGLAEMVEVPGKWPTNAERKLYARQQWRP